MRNSFAQVKMDKTKNAARIQCTICNEDFQVGIFFHLWYFFNSATINPSDFVNRTLWKDCVPDLIFAPCAVVGCYLPETSVPDDLKSGTFFVWGSGFISHLYASFHESWKMFRYFTNFFWPNCCGELCSENAEYVWKNVKSSYLHTRCIQNQSEKCE